MPDESFLALIAHNEHVRRARARRNRRLREVAASVVIAALLAALGVEIAAFRATDRSSDQPAPPPLSTTTSTTKQTSIPVVPPSTPTTTASTTTTSARAKPLELQMIATRGASWVEARENTARGEVLYSGIVKQGTSLTLAADRMWIRFGSVGNLDLRLNGKPVRAAHSGTIDAVVTRTGLHG